jgi:transposase
MVLEQQSVSSLSAEQLRALPTRLLTDVRHKQAVIDKLTHENALLKRLKFAAQSERYSAEQRSLLDETLDTDLQAVSEEIAQNALPAATPPDKQQPKRQPLPAHLPRREIRHEPVSTTCGCGCQMLRIGEDVAEKLDYEPGVFTVERHIRGKWALPAAKHWCKPR